MGFLTGKKIVVMGVANKRSIAWGCAQAIAEQGGEVIYTYQNDRMKKSLEKMLNGDEFLVECDVADDDSIKNAFDQIKDYAGQINGVVHAVAFADKDDLQGNVSDISRKGYSLAQDISSYSLIAVTHYAKPLLAEGSGIVTLTYFGSQRAVPNYNMMGIAKASLEAAVRYLATEFAQDQVHVNAISAGAVKTLAVTGVKDYNKLIQLSQERTADEVSVTTNEIGNVCAFLVSPLASGVIGETIFVDKGVHLS
ncbi:enoyl-ACP reductase FabI [Tetragenococcus koreensis]|uniref:enoyl-ACP reductase FabI n=1 Tax=Tetragenococcus koreensis TaxID=290335 RepID=UPI001F265F7B|nr:enoyl-ACP reductase FabI [Tetragenococcus koreensis]MCF1616419.1 enoyl-ACP reductase FabI [Tetragenococcus koreensis]MCF1621082.1 enoyl-ACP reductase FabI [Tetragenococcus koreensis]MCF1626503.1 enoyl-ACP reductase FabI [Tetragenococcus koreensis]MCF1631466.1 enoyl-ACP reductase FabI [Tetragenococcus koreensis]MCF1677470.1 enoyl-ACP reductase FabI [Tetragenococcus koreensis]